MAPTRIYMVSATTKAAMAGARARLVRARNAAQALGHVASDTFTVSVATQNDLVVLIEDGVAVETAGVEPQT